jgi:S-DNA-T family DNA segregation ATPase FtsK/SpoIIIE
MRSSHAATLTINEGAVRRIVKRNLSAFIGLAALAIAAGTAASLATWTVSDPSLSHTTDGTIRNVLGLPGAIISDLLTQLLGLAATLVLLPPVIWAWRIVFGRQSGFSRYVALSWLGATLAATLALASMPIARAWPLPTGLGGAVGDMLLRFPAFFTGGEITGLAAAASAMVLAAIAIAANLHACGLIFYQPALSGEGEEPATGRVPAVAAPVRRQIQPLHDDNDDDHDHDDDQEDDYNDQTGRLALAMGGLTHLAYSALSSIRRRYSGADPSRRDFDDPGEYDYASTDRIEPSMSTGEFDDELSERLDDDFEPDSEEGFDPGFEGNFEEELEPPPAVKPKKRRVRKAASKPRAGKRQAREAQSSLFQRDGFTLPQLDLLKKPPAASRGATVSADALEQNARLLEGVLDDFGIRGEIVNVRPGPVVTLYELEPAPGIKSSRVIGLADDIARSMSAISCRVAVIPGKNAIGIELPNSRRETVFLRELLASEDFEKTKSRLGLCMGKTIGGEPVTIDLARMPHLLVAGTTGSGKSVSINTMILSLLYRMTPQQCRLIMIDPKMLELSAYDGIPHLLTPVVTDPKQAVIALKWTTREMEDRYRKMSKLGVRNIDGFNVRVTDALTTGETLSRTVHTGFDPDTGEAIYEQEELALEAMPYIVVIIDEMADLMMVAGKDIEGTVQRLAQMARAAGIHVIMATQRPSVDVITGTIKANFPTRISFQVTSKIDSRTILGEQGAEQLLGQGDMLYMAGGGRIQRVHGPFVSDDEVEAVVRHLKSQGAPDYLHTITVDETGGGEGDMQGGGDSSANSLYDQAVAVVLRDGKASTSYIQRRLSIGYNRAASIIERMEDEGVVSAANHAGKREILVRDGAGIDEFA